MTVEGVAELVQGMVAEEGDEQLFAEILWLREHPLDLNSASRDEFLRVPGLTEADLAVVLAARADRGKFRSVQDLRRIRKGGMRLFELLSPFVTVTPSGNPVLSLRNRLTCGSPWEEHPDWLGAPTKEYHRVEYSSPGGMTAGGTFTRDAGERHRDARIAGYAVLPDLLCKFRAVVGDFALLSGYGLVHGSAAGASSALGARSMTPTGMPLLKQYSGANPQLLLRGIALERRWRRYAGDVTGLLYVSRIPLTAAVGPAGTIQAIRGNDDFSTARALAARHSVAEWTFGGHLGWRGLKGLSCGFSAQIGAYSHPLEREGGADARVRLLGLYALLSDSRLACGGELALSGREWAGIVHLRMLFPPASHVEIVYHHATRGFSNPRGVAWALGGTPKDIEHVRLRWSLPQGNGITLSGHLGHWRRHWRTTFDHMPPSGTEGAIRMELRVLEKCRWELQYSTGSAEETETHMTEGGLTVTRMDPSYRRRVSVSLRLTPTSRLTMRSGFQMCRVRGGPDQRLDRGEVLTQDVGWQPVGSIRLSARISLYRTTSYDSRLYAAESDLDGVYTNPALSGTGFRWYLTGRLAAGRGIVCSLKFAQSFACAGPAYELRDQLFALQLDLTPLGP